ncbi:hypothetical protein SCHPADRAFT_894369 [Schizopora paradoxa]|uniref:Uncharacterized protein n=1 Tax=Schizopora paradoxa TaxID=27342 RepID=A0A0H2RSG4_9AGAM|nr:hypothetical protein SCHPADRAFT_894369 [Schizopora paradoxa]
MTSPDVVQIVLLTFIALLYLCMATPYYDSQLYDNMDDVHYKNHEEMLPENHESYLGPTYDHDVPGGHSNGGMTMEENPLEDTGHTDSTDKTGGMGTEYQETPHNLFPAGEQSPSQPGIMNDPALQFGDVNNRNDHSLANENTGNNPNITSGPSNHAVDDHANAPLESPVWDEAVIDYKGYRILNISGDEDAMRALHRAWEDGLMIHSISKPFCDHIQEFNYLAGFYIDNSEINQYGGRQTTLSAVDNVGNAIGLTYWIHNKSSNQPVKDDEVTFEVHENKSFYWNGLEVSNRTNDPRAFEALERAWGHSYPMKEIATFFPNHIQNLQQDHESGLCLTGLDIVHNPSAEPCVTLEAKYGNELLGATYKIYEIISQTSSAIKTGSVTCVAWDQSQVQQSGPWQPHAGSEDMEMVNDQYIPNNASDQSNPNNEQFIADYEVANPSNEEGGNQSVMNEENKKKPNFLRRINNKLFDHPNKTENQDTGSAPSNVHSSGKPGHKSLKDKFSDKLHMHSNRQDIQLGVSENLLGANRTIAYEALNAAKCDKNLKVFIRGDDHFNEPFVEHINNPTQTGLEFFSISELFAMTLTGRPDESINFRAFDLLVIPLNNKNIPLFYIYKMQLQVDAANNVSVKSVTIQDNDADFQQKGFKELHVPYAEQSGEFAPINGYTHEVSQVNLFVDPRITGMRRLLLTNALVKIYTKEYAPGMNPNNAIGFLRAEIAEETFRTGFIPG